MAVLTFEVPAEGLSGKHSVIIDNWRYITETVYWYGNSSRAPGTRMILKDSVIDILGYTPNMIHDIIYQDSVVQNSLFTMAGRDHPGYCRNCGGHGQIDWVSSAMNNSRRYGEFARLFERDKKVAMYYKSDGKLLFSMGTFSRAIVKEGHKVCKLCNGTGLNLDARHAIFAGMPGIRNKLKGFEWDGINLPG